MMRKIENAAWLASALLFAGVVLAFTVQAVRPFTFYFIYPLGVTAGGAYVLNRINRMIRLRDAMKASHTPRPEA